ncbi:pentapeptide repeat-containing protein [Nocardia sp. NPDC050793]|uniref:pentapeptide repeat-containing protein n=1 Tax=Nocardia sp. NPDC050793 TaxID=3155159 RepID=UPI0034061A33
MARELTDLPFARYLTPLEEEPEREGDYDCVHVDDRQLEHLAAEHVRFAESALSSLTVTRGSFRYGRFVDVWLRAVAFVGTELADTSWQDAEFVEGALSGVDAGGAVLRRVRFEGCKFDSVNFRGAKLREVSFVDCVLRHTDFGDAELNTVSFPGSDLTDLSLNKTRMRKVDLRGATRIGVAEGLDGLRGATITPLQLMDLAPSFASMLGIIVADES